MFKFLAQHSQLSAMCLFTVNYPPSVRMIFKKTKKLVLLTLNNDIQVMHRKISGKAHVHVGATLASHTTPSKYPWYMVQ